MCELSSHLILSIDEVTPSCLAFQVSQTQNHLTALTAAIPFCKTLFSLITEITEKDAIEQKAVQCLFKGM